MGPMVFWIGSILESFIFTRLNSRRLYKDLADRGYKLKYMDDQEIKLEESPLYMHFIPFFNLLETAGSILEYNYLLDNTIEYFKNENMVSPMNQKEREYYRENPTVKTALMIAESDYQRRKFGNKIILKGDSSEWIITYYYDFTDNSIGVYSVTGELSKLDDDDIMEITVTLLENSLYEYYEKYSVRRYGFHGTSHKFVSHRAADKIGKNIKDLRIITCHLGNGSSIAAVDHGKVVDTSMGFTPLDGFMMGTRSGGVDPSAVTFIMKNENLTPDEMDAILNKQSGVQAISGISSDDRDICKAQEEGDERAILAHEMQAYEIAKFIGSYVAAMNGVDAIVFTGGIGENGVWLRSKVCSYLGYLGVHINEAVNSKTQKGAEAELTEPTDDVRVFILATDEELMIARDTEELVKSL